MNRKWILLPMLALFLAVFAFGILRGASGPPQPALAMLNDDTPEVAAPAEAAPITRVTARPRPTAKPLTFDAICDVLYFLENNGRDPVNRYQITYCYYIDAAKELKSHYGQTAPDYRAAIQSDYWSRRLILAYMHRFCPTALARLDAFTIARFHRFGCEGWKTGSNTYPAKACQMLRAKGYTPIN